MSDLYTSSSYYYSSATSTTNGTETSGHRYTTTSHTDPVGTTIVRTAHQDLGRPAVIEERRYDRTGQELLLGPGSSTAGGTRRITDLTDDYAYTADDTAYTASTNSSADDVSATTGTSAVDVDVDAVSPVSGRRYHGGDARIEYG